jgi:penicillin-binding protein 1A
MKERLRRLGDALARKRSEIGARLRPLLLRLRRLGAELKQVARTRRGGIALAGLVLLGLASCGAGAATAAWTRACEGGCPTADQIIDFAPQQASVLYDANGEVLGMFYRERRQVVDLESLPPHVPMAFVAIEDRRFFDHEGVDLWRFMGSVVDNLLNGFGASGFSTITMQIPRNLFPQQIPRGETSIRRKLAEVRIAVEMEERLSKAEILELYLNTINLGAGAYGIEAAARTYFDKPASELTPLEAAMLAGLPQAPSAYNPRRNPEGALRRRNVVLAAMAETGVLTRSEASEALTQELGLAPPRGVNRAPYFVEHVRRELEDRFGEILYTGGLRIQTTIDPVLQEEAESALEEHLREIEDGKYGRFRHPRYAATDSARRGAPASAVETPYLQGVVVVLDPRTGDVLAMVGGRDFDHSQFNRATQALRQPGSAFKPFVYAAALERGKSPLYRVSDSPIFLTQSDGSTWNPRNFSGEYDGEITLREALRRSKNMVAIRLGQEVGVDFVRDVARRAGIDTPIPGYPSVFIGAAGVYPLDLIAAYAPFSNGGMRVEPRFVRRIESHEGHLLWEPRRPPVPAIQPAISWILTDMLREVVDRGTAYNVRSSSVGNLSYEVPAAGKTGTTNDNTDVWFVGYTPDLLAGVWLGLDQPETITASATGGGFAVPVWARVVRKYYESHEVPQPWTRPPDVVTRNINTWTGLAVADDCPYILGSYTDLFAADAAPEPGCEPPKFWDPQPQLPGRPLLRDRPGPPRIRGTVDTLRRRKDGPGH